MADQKSLGYDDTPFLPGNKWRVHDGSRPQPTVIDPGTASTQQEAGRPPADAKILFDGTDLSQWEGKEGAANWKIENGYMEVTPKSGNIKTKEKFGSCHLHVEFASPEVVKGDGQGRGNSGVFLLSLYEVQVLDCYQNPTYPDGTSGALYGQCPPLFNACRAPGQWQTYDIFFETPEFDGDNVTRPAYITVIHNGIPLHHHKELIGPTLHKEVAAYKPHEVTGPLMLQDHGDLVRFRNIWIRGLGEYK